MSNAVCTGCGKALSGADVLYSSAGDVVCAECNDKSDLVDTDKRAAGNIVKAGWAGLGSGVLAFGAGMSLLGIIVWLFVATTLVSSIFALKGLAPGNERFSKLLSTGQRTTATVCAVAGIVLAGLTVLGVPVSITMKLF
jgi:hypothetical protein